MGRKRRQRSTAIRRRIEKKQREQEKQARRNAKRNGPDEDVLLTMTVDAAIAGACSKGLTELGGRLAESSIRGWTADDFEGQYGLTWFAGALGAASEAAGGTGESTLEVERTAKGKILDKLNALEMAAPGLSLDWDVGFLDLSRALSHAEEPPPPPEEDEDEDDDDEADA